MANYNAWARTNYVRFKNIEAVKRLCEQVGAELVKGNDKAQKESYAILFGENGIPREIGLEEEQVDQRTSCTKVDVETIIDFPWAVADYLEDDEVIIFQEVGQEKLCYVSGYAIAINAKGESRDISLSEIMERAKELTTKNHKITAPEN